MRFKRIKEGLIDLYVPAVDLPERGRARGFYNPVMEFDRDMSVVFVKLVKSKTVLDAMSATGVRGIRYAKECDCRVWLNDVNEKAVELIKRNVALNKIKSRILKMTWDDCNRVMVSNKFDFIDLDPYGSPVWSLDSAVQGLSRKGGFLAVTATDLGALFGRYPEACYRRYFFRSQKTDYSRELGARILVTAIIREFAKHDRAFIPLLTYYRRHYIRTYGKVVEKLSELEKLLSEIRPVELEKSTWSVGKGQLLYLGKIENKNFLKKMKKEICKSKFQLLKQELKLLALLIEEADAPLFYYDMHQIYRGKEIPSMEKLLKKYKGVRTHFCGTGIKTSFSKL